MAGADAVEEGETDVHTEVVRMTVFIGQNYFDVLRNETCVTD